MGDKSPKNTAKAGKQKAQAKASKVRVDEAKK